MIWNCLKGWLSKCARGNRRDTPFASRACKPAVERLEDRYCPSTVFALTSNNHLISFDTEDTSTILSDTKITGIEGGKNIVGIDFRPATGELFALTRFNLYTINTTTGAATKVGDARIDPAPEGGLFGFDFNPTVDRIRVVSNDNQNLRLNPITGALASEDADLAFAAMDVNAGQDPEVQASAYTNNDNVGTTTTTLFGIDTELDILVTQNPPNDGTLNTVGSLGVNATGRVSFDIFSNLDATGAATSNTAYATLSKNKLYTIDLLTGTATFVGDIGTHQPIKGIALALDS